MTRVGVAGWSYADWKGRVYPRKKSSSFSALTYLARYVECMELNSSFYAYPSQQNCASWVGQLHGTELPFLVKLHRDFTHAQDPWRSTDQFDQSVAAFLAGLDPLREDGRLQLLLLQFPFSFARTKVNRVRLDRLASAFSSERLVVELRHSSWFEPQVLDRFGERSLSVANIDLPFAKDHPPERHRPTGPIGYLRLHGRNAEHWFRTESTRDQRYDYLYSPSELDQLAQTARDLEKEHDEVYVVTNNHFEGQAVANALELRARLSGTKPAAPPELREAFPQLRTATKSDGPPELF